MNETHSFSQNELPTKIVNFKLHAFIAAFVGVLHQQRTRQHVQLSTLDASCVHRYPLLVKNTNKGEKCASQHTRRVLCHLYTLLVKNTNKGRRTPTRAGTTPASSPIKPIQKAYPVQTLHCVAFQRSVCTNGAS